MSFADYEIDRAIARAPTFAEYPAYKAIEGR
nr:MAG TPA: hypothetical protein [Caudoviricetes sp.]